MDYVESVPADLGVKVTGCFTTRAGGVSAGPWRGLNLALHVGDDTDRVLANRDLLARHLGTGWVNLPQQVHGAGVRVVDAGAAGRRRITRGGARGADALVTVTPGVPVAVLVADCLPVLLCDPIARVVAAAHAGRAGLAAGVLPATVAAMTGLGAVPERLTAVIGPAVCGRCYEVPGPLRDEVAALVPGSAATTSWGSPALDLPAGAEGVLRELGIVDVRQTGICTMTDERFYSYRRNGQTGRFAGVAMLDP